VSYLERLRPASFVAPDGTEQEFFVDTLKKTGGKKSSTQEIIDSDESLTQDQGNRTYSFSVDAYFPGADYDLSVDSFVSLLEQRHTLETPGTLKHPRYGDITVFPTEWSITEELVSGNQIGRISITFVEVFPRLAPVSTLDDLESAFKNILDLELLSSESAAEMNLEKEASQANMTGNVTSSTGIISNSFKEILSTAEDLQETFDTVQKEINSLIDDVGGNIVQIMSAIQTLIRTPGRIIERTLNKIDTYASMIESLTESILDVNESSKIELRNNSIFMQLVAGFAVAAMNEALAFNDFQIRSEPVTGIEKVNEALDTYNAAFEESRTDGKVSEEYSGDHNFYSLLFDTITRINRIVLNSAFDLKAEKKYTLKNNSDIITECYEKYGKIDQDTITFFQNTNKIINNEYIEIPAGRELLVYV